MLWPIKILFIIFMIDPTAWCHHSPLLLRHLLYPLNLLLDLFAREHLSLAQVNLNLLILLTNLHRPVKLDLVAQELHHLEGVFDCLTLPTAPTLLAVVIVLKLKN